MTTSERDWLQREQPNAMRLTPEGTEHARSALRAHIAGTDLGTGGLPAGRREPARVRHPRLVRLFGAAAGVGIAGAVAVAVVSVGTGHSVSAVRSAPGHTHVRRPVKPLLLRTADAIASNPLTGGDATLIVRTTTSSSAASVSVDDLYTDDGKYYFGSDRSQLAAAVSSGDTEAGGLFAREVAAARSANTGDVAAAAQALADAPDPGNVVPRSDPGRFENWVWGDALDALNAGAGDPQVRSGVLKILATLSDVTVTQTSTDGEPTVTLTAGPAVFGGDAASVAAARAAGKPGVVSNYQEQLVIDAQTGVPIRFTGGLPGNPQATVTYQVSRVTAGDL